MIAEDRRLPACQQLSGSRSALSAGYPLAAPPAEARGRQAQAHRPQKLHPRDRSGYARNFGSEAASAGEGLHFLIKIILHRKKTVRSPLGPLCEGAPPAGGGGENCTVAQNISGYGKVLSLRPFGAPLPPLAQAPPPPYRGSLSRRGRFFDTPRRDVAHISPFCGDWQVESAAFSAPP